ncbi:hypothetical protein [Pseudomonas saponiphila]|nr:hypothetical protein [Pseudomonas saponiphila]
MGRQQTQLTVNARLQAEYAPLNLTFDPRGSPMAKPNYSFAKRQRDLAKEQKKEEKLQRKKAAAEESNAADADPEVSIDDAEPEAPQA